MPPMPPMIIPSQGRVPITLSSEEAATSAFANRRKRVRTGCITCRVRRVKCDETRPACTRCTSTGRRCDGYEAALVSRNELSRALRRGEHVSELQFGSSTFSSSEERQVFEYFRLNTSASGAANVFGWGFWDKVVLQFVHSEPAIKHGVLALSYLHRDFSGGHDAYSPSNPAPFFRSQKALQQYGIAVRNAGQLFAAAAGGDGSSNFEKVLTACIIFISIENLMANPKGARMHLLNGLRIEKEHSARKNRTNLPSGKDHSTAGIVSQALGRVDFTEMTMSTSEAPYPYSEQHGRTDHAVNIPTHFSTLNEAEKYIFSMLRDLFGFAESMGVAINAFEMLAKITLATGWFARQLDNWTAAFEPLASRLERLDDATRSRCVLLRVYHKLTCIIVRAGHSPNEMAFDLFDDEFSTSLDMIEESCTLQAQHNRTGGGTAGNIFSLEGGVLTPLFVIAFRCRHPQIRRRAIALMRSQRRREAMWDSIGAATCCEWLMRMEEGPGELLPDGRPADCNRARVLAVDVRYDEHKLAVKAFFPSQSAVENLRSVEGLLPFCMGVGSRDDCICSRDASTRLRLENATVVDREYRKLRFDPVAGGSGGSDQQGRDQYSSSSSSQAKPLREVDAFPPSRLILGSRNHAADVDIKRSALTVGRDGAFIDQISEDDGGNYINNDYNDEDVFGAYYSFDENENNSHNFDVTSAPRRTGERGSEATVGREQQQQQQRGGSGTGTSTSTRISTPLPPQQQQQQPLIFNNKDLTRKHLIMDDDGFFLMSLDSIHVDFRADSVMAETNMYDDGEREFSIA